MMTGELDEYISFSTTPDPAGTHRTNINAGVQLPAFGDDAGGQNHPGESAGQAGLINILGDDEAHKMSMGNGNRSWTSSRKTR